MSADERRAVAALYTVARTGKYGPDEADALRPFDDADHETGLRLQLGVLDRWIADGALLGGWKVGLTSRTARDSMGAGVRPPGYVLATRVLYSGAELPPGIANVRLEPEIGVVLGRDLAGPDVTIEQARAAVEAVAPALEINVLRLPGTASAAARVGNALNNWGIVFGPPRPTGSLNLATLPVSISGPAGTLGTGSSGPATIDDPYLSLTRLCHALAANGRGLTAGQHIITGSLTAPVPAKTPGRYQADFGPLGIVTLDVLLG